MRTSAFCGTFFPLLRKSEKSRRINGVPLKLCLDQKGKLPALPAKRSHKKFYFQRRAKRAAGSTLDDGQLPAERRPSLYGLWGK